MNNLLVTVSGKVDREDRERFAEIVQRKGRSVSAAISDFVSSVASGQLNYDPGRPIIAPSKGKGK